MSTGPDRINNGILIKTSTVLTVQLVKVFNKCLNERKFPSCWKEADLIIPNKGQDKDPAELKCYRPINILNRIGKRFERIISARLWEDLDTLNIISE